MLGALQHAPMHLQHLHYIFKAQPTAVLIRLRQSISEFNLARNAVFNLNQQQAVIVIGSKRQLRNKRPAVCLPGVIQNIAQNGAQFQTAQR